MRLFYCKPNCLLFIFIALFLISCGRAFTGIPAGNPVPEFRNFYGIAWNGTPSENLAYARQMGYHYVFYQKGMEDDTASSGLFFYLESPEYSVYPRRLETNRAYSEEEIGFFELNYALMNGTKPFPGNIARGWFFNSYAFTPQLDLQQQRVIDWAVDSIIQHVKAIEARNPAFRFGGYAWDVPQPPGDFYDTIQHPGRQRTLAFWTGGDFGVRHPQVTHEYETYSDGRIAFYKQLYKKTRQHYPHARFIMEPYKVYEDWVEWIENRPDAREVMPDMLVQEKDGVEFTDDERIFQSGLITREFVGSTTPNIFGEEANRTTAAIAAINGSWFSWYGRFGGTGDMPHYRSVRDVPQRIRLVRMLANWENLHGIPLSDRSWDGTVYSSPKAYVSPDVIYLTQPGTNKMFVLFLTEKGQVNLPGPAEEAIIFRTDDMFMESGNGADDFEINSNVLRIGSSDKLGKAYIILYSGQQQGKQPGRDIANPDPSQ
jgi:hypothetical protein